MTITKIIQGINDELAGELLTTTELTPFIDSVIDDINSQLDSCFPVFSEFNQTDYSQYPDYNFFPDKYIRSVVIKGAAYKFYVMDEEGIPTAQMYQYNYQDNLFVMLRDYLEDVPEKYRAKHQSSVIGLSDVAYDIIDRDPKPWRCENPSCGVTNIGKFCTACGWPKPVPQTWTCPTCEHKNLINNKYCCECGTQKPLT